MKNCLLVLVAGIMLCVPLGCDRQVEEDPVSYERDVDGPPVVIRTPMPDYDVIGKPSVVRSRREALLASSGDAASGDAASGDVDLSGPVTAASDGEVGEVKAVIEAILATKAGGDDSAAIVFFDEDTAASIKGMKQATEALQAKVLALDLLMEDKFGAQYPAKVKENIKKMPTETAGSTSATGILGAVSIEQLIFGKIGEKVVATGPQNAKYIFTKTVDGWRLGLDKGKQEMVGILGELLQATVKMVDGMTAGINDGSITADNVEAKGEELGNQHVKPIEEKLAKIMMKAMGDAAPADGDAAPADGAAAPADGDAAPADGDAAPADGDAAPADGAAAPAATPPAGEGL